VYRLYQLDEKHPAVPEVVTGDESELAAVGALVCAACRRRITTAEARIEIAGAHVHECVNPHGWRWRIGCFAVAEGLVVISEPETAWSWFPGYTWEIENCGGCGALLGWLYRNGDSSFHGLILAHLIEDKH